MLCPLFLCLFKKSQKHSNLILTVLDWNNVSLSHREDPAEYKYEDDEDSNDEDNVRDVMLHQYSFFL